MLHVPLAVQLNSTQHIRANPAVPFPWGLSQPFPSVLEAGREEGQKAELCRASRTHSCWGGSSWPWLQRRGSFLAPGLPPGHVRTLLSNRDSMKVISPLPQYFSGAPSTLYFWKKDRRKTDVHRMESNIQEIRAAEHHLKQIPHFNFFTYSISG